MLNRHTSRPPDDHRLQLSRFIRALLSVSLTLASATATAQTLAHPGWVGNGISVTAWWQHAVFYQVATPPAGSEDEFKYIADRLDALRSLGIDALLLPAPQLPPPGTNGAMPDLEPLDNLLRQASSRDIRVILTIQPPNAAADLTGIARFWLNRGIAGLHIASTAGETPEQQTAAVDSLRKLTAASLGQRILISDLDLAPPPAAVEPARRAARSDRRAKTKTVAELEIDTRLDHLPAFDAANLRPLLAQDIAQSNLLLDMRTPAGRSQLDRAIATVALLTHPVTLIDSTAGLVLEPAPQPEPAAQPEPTVAPPTPKPLPPGTYVPYVPYVPPARPKRAPVKKPAPPDPLTTWYRQLAALHGDNAAIRNGTKIFLDFDAQNALVWVNRPASPSPTNPAVVVLCNLSTSPVQLSLDASMKQLNLHGTFLRPLLRSFEAMGAEDLNAVTLPPYGVYIGEVRR
jgi:hypothetical protein